VDILAENKITNQTFTLLEGYKVGARSGEGFITVDGTGLYGCPKARIKVRSEKDFTISGELAAPIVKKSPIARRNAAASKTVEAVNLLEDNSIPDVESTETDEEVLSRISKRFNVLNKLTLGARRGDIRALFVTGAPGVGKTYGVEQTLGEAGMIEQFEDAPKRYEIVSGSMSPLGLFMKLYEFSGENDVLVLDDCDAVFSEEDSLNLLKAALDTSEKRKIYWNLDSRVLNKAEVPNDFEFKGSVIFISTSIFARFVVNEFAPTFLPYSPGHIFLT